MPAAGPAFGEMRRRAGLTQRELAARLDVSEETIRRLERPHRGPSGRLVRRLAVIELERALLERGVRNPDDEGGTT